MDSSNSMLLPPEAARMRRVSPARAAAQAQALRRYLAGAKRLADGDRAYDEGDLRAATMIYIALAHAKPATPSTEQAKQRLAKLADEARRKLQEVDDMLVPGGYLATQQPPPDTANREITAETIQEAFQKYDRVAAQYGAVPAVKRELASHIASQRRHPRYAAVLNEPEARELWDLGQQHEAEDARCCAYWVYKEALHLVPAPSAVLARQRLQEFEQDPQVVEAAKVCQDLRWCHKAYERAMMLARMKPEAAENVFSQILARAPHDSEVYRAAYTEYEHLGGPIEK